MGEYGGPERDTVRPVDPVDPVDPGIPVDPATAVNPADPMMPRPVIDEKPMRTWLWPTLLIFGFVVGVALLVMIVVSSADFGDEPARVTPTPGSCQPFCTNTGAPPAP
ncbi:hypothetical protein [Nocardia sp. CA-290969]|uniref:hypothetical protein n=1 Tax=Nocardia sp. CA-290969 TaxID=3239986 RepID=UPI003D8F786F